MRRGLGFVILLLTLAGGLVGCREDAQARLDKLRRLEEMRSLDENILAHRAGAGMRQIKPGNGRAGPRLMGSTEADEVGARRWYDSRSRQRVGGGEAVVEEEEDRPEDRPRQPRL
jgi:hypothetical protein